MDLLALDAALDRLAERDPQKARLVELRYFAGLTGDQAAAVLGISPSSADRQWTYTRAWLRRELGSAPGPDARFSERAGIPDAGGADSRIEGWRPRRSASEVRHERRRDLPPGAGPAATPRSARPTCEQACGGDAALRASVEALLRADVGATGFMERPPPDPAATVDVPIGERPGTVIGPYKLLEQIGEGGMGTVWMAAADRAGQAPGGRSSSSRPGWTPGRSSPASRPSARPWP